MDDRMKDKILLCMLRQLNDIRKNTERMVNIALGDKNRQSKIDQEVAMLLGQVRVMNALRVEDPVIQDLKDQEDK